jgi:hypothetical protein
LLGSELGIILNEGSKLGEADGKVKLGLKLGLVLGITLILGRTLGVADGNELKLGCMLKLGVENGLALGDVQTRRQTWT